MDVLLKAVELLLSDSYESVDVGVHCYIVQWDEIMHAMLMLTSNDSFSTWHLSSDALDDQVMLMSENSFYLALKWLE